ncbi:hypothetical protein [Endozoicomonas arenosclerae]|uniref:hypothetical protein n=1 Tax=Endozoicomonas arenosclerae TaxID=1633495 RepID=UPI000781464D|nr:hypothetical protein [Endozoicomonas arenosclerae]
MTTGSLIFACLMGAMFVACILYVVFGQVTVRKLRKNPKTKEVLGLEYVSGWDIINVAQALAIPRSWSRKLEKSPLSTIYANSAVLFENTSKLDRLLGTVFYWLLMTSGLSGALLVLLNSFGLIPDVKA